MASAIRVDDVSKRYIVHKSQARRLLRAFSPFSKPHSDEEFWALKNISFDVGIGECVGILGRNGAGKSTLLEIIAGTVPPSDGRVEVNGRMTAMLELGSGFNPEFTGLENVFLAAAILGFSQQETSAKLGEIVEFADIGEYVNQPVKTYSSGMMMRLAFAVQILLDPAILIVDEALSVGDWYFQQKCLARIIALRERGVSMLFVSHSMETIKAFCHRGLVLKRGELIFDGPAAAACDKYSSEATVNPSDAALNPIALTAEEVSAAIPFRVISQLRQGLQPDESFARRLTERSGQGELRFDNVAILDEEDRVVTSCESFSRVRLAVTFETTTDIPAGTAIGILCRNHLGLNMFSCNANLHGVYLPALKAHARYQMEFALIWPLLPGVYSLHVGAKPNPKGDYFYDRCFGALVFEVSAPPVLRDRPFGGVVWVTPREVSVQQIQ